MPNKKITDIEKKMKEYPGKINIGGNVGGGVQVTESSGNYAAEIDKINNRLTKSDDAYISLRKKVGEGTKKLDDFGVAYNKDKGGMKTDYIERIGAAKNVAQTGIKKCEETIKQVDTALQKSIIGLGNRLGENEKEFNNYKGEVEKKFGETTELLQKKIDDSETKWNEELKTTKVNYTTKMWQIETDYKSLVETTKQNIMNDVDKGFEIAAGETIKINDKLKKGVDEEFNKTKAEYKALIKDVSDIRYSVIEKTTKLMAGEIDKKFDATKIDYTDKIQKETETRQKTIEDKYNAWKTELNTKVEQETKILSEVQQYLGKVTSVLEKEVENSDKIKIEYEAFKKQTEIDYKTLEEKTKTAYDRLAEIEKQVKDLSCLHGEKKEDGYTAKPAEIIEVSSTEAGDTKPIEEQKTKKNIEEPDNV